MHKLLFLLPDLTYRGAAQQAGLLATGLRDLGIRTHVCALGASGPVAERLRAAGLDCSALGWRHWFDGAAFWQLRHLIRDVQPAVIHTWGAAALRAALGAAGAVPRRIVSSAALPLRRGGFLGQRLAQWCFHQVSQVVARTAAEVARYQQLRVVQEKIVHAVSGVALEQLEEARRPTAVAEDARLIMCVGPVEPHKGFRAAIWALDVLRYLYRDLHLVVLGEGSDIPRLRQFAKAIAVAPFVHFVGPQDDVQAWLRAADVVWVPTLTRGGTQVALEAMAAGRPVVASAVHDLAHVVTDGVTGYLTPPNDPVALARQTRLLLENDALRDQFGAAGRDRIQQSFTAEHLVRRFARLYNALTN